MEAARARAAVGAHVVLLEDDEEMRELLAGTLVGAGYEVSAYPSGLELLERLETGAVERFDLVVSDVRMPGVSGLCMLEGIGAWSVGGRTPMILITAFGSPELHARARRFGAVTVLDKPFAMERLLAAVRAALGEGRAGPA